MKSYRRHMELQGTTRRKVRIISILNGIYPHDTVRRMNTVQLERLVKNLVEQTSPPKKGCNGKKYIAKKPCQRPKWWPKTLTFAQPINQLRVISTNLNSWRMMLVQLVHVCSLFYNRIRSKIKGTSADEIKPAETCKQIRLDPQSENKSRKLVIQPNYPVVRVHDVLRPYKNRVVSKNEYMSILHLMPKHSKFNHTNPNDLRLSTVKVTSMSKIPISSEYGQILLKQSQKGVSNELYAARKLQCIEWNMLNTDISSRDQRVKVNTKLKYSKRHVLSNAYVYKFPRRQAYQLNGKGYSTEFLKSLCRPVKVDIERLKVKEKMKDLKIVLPRLSLRDIIVIKQPVVLLERNV